MATKLTVTQLKLQRVPGSQNELFASWSFAKHSQTEEYRVKWTSVGKPVGGKTPKETTIDTGDRATRQARFTFPENTKYVTVAVKPISKTHKVSTTDKNGKTKKEDKKYWESQYSSTVQFSLDELPPVNPGGFSVNYIPNTIDTIRLEVTNASTESPKATHVQFAYVKDNNTTTHTIGTVQIVNRAASVTFTMNADSKYQFKMRGLDGSDVSKAQHSAWSEYTVMYSRPGTPTGYPVITRTDTTTAKVTWSASNTAENYTVSYTSNADNFSTGIDVQEITTVDNTTSAVIAINDYIGGEIYVRVRANRENASSSDWSNIASINLASQPSPPTVWQSKSKVELSENLYLNWKHNPLDGTTMGVAQLKMNINGVDRVKTFDYVTCNSATSDAVKVLTNVSDRYATAQLGIYFSVTMLNANSVTNGLKIKLPNPINEVLVYGTDDQKRWDAGSTVLLKVTGTTFSNARCDILDNNTTMGRYCVEYDDISAGDTITWQVATTGYKNGDMSRYSETNQFTVYSPPTVECSIGPLEDGVIKNYPLVCAMNISAVGQTPVAHTYYINAEEGYEATAPDGSEYYVSAGDTVYSRVVYSSSLTADLWIEPQDVTLENDIHYSLNVTCATDAGFTATASTEFICEFEDVDYYLYSETIYNETDHSVTLTPHVETINELYNGDFANKQIDGVPTYADGWTGICYAYTDDNGDPYASMYISSTSKVYSIQGVPPVHGGSYYFSFEYKSSLETMVDVTEDMSNTPLYGPHAYIAALPAKSDWTEVSVTIHQYQSVSTPGIFRVAFYSNYSQNVNIQVRNVSIRKTDDPVAYLSVYRAQYDGTFELIEKNMQLGASTHDPHPTLINPRYRLVAQDRRTGSISAQDFSIDIPDSDEIILQWNEAWDSYVYNDAKDVPDGVDLNASIIRLRYNIDISTDITPEVSMVNYVGRTHPVSYYGTKLETSGQWAAEIPADDFDTLYMLRRLQNWFGDVYVRTPNGAGYWANVTVSFREQYNSVSVPVTLNVTRVEGNGA